MGQGRRLAGEAVVTAAAEPAGAGDRFGAFQVHERLGQGGMATVHRATCELGGGGREVALKRLHGHLTGCDRNVERLVIEGALMAQLDHPNIVRLVRRGWVGDVAYLAMERVVGPSLRDLMRDDQRRGVRLPLAAVVVVLDQLLAALDHAHERVLDGRLAGVIHRDVSPANVLVALTGQVTLIDFGIARARDDDETGAYVQGTPAYLAPEGQAGQVDPRGDLFAVGVIGHELLTGLPLFAGASDLDTLRRIHELDIPPPSRLDPSVPLELDAVIMGALARPLDRRWSSAKAMRRLLHRAAEWNKLGYGRRALVQHMTATSAPLPLEVRRRGAVPGAPAEFADGTRPRSRRPSEPDDLA